MTPEEKNLITSLFQRLQASDTSPKDREAEQLIQSLTASQPSAPYLLAQTVLVQEHALQNAQARISQLERQVAEASSRAASQPQGGSFLSGLLHPRSSSPPPIPAGATAGSAYAAAPQPPPYPSTVGMPPSAAGGFLKGALTTAAGVAGGALLFEGIQNLLGHHAGPFSSGLTGFGGGGIGGLPGTENVTENVDVTNNYYGTESPASQDASFLPADDDSVQPANENYADVPDNQDAGNDYDTPTDDSGGDGGGGDSWA